MEQFDSTSFNYVKGDFEYELRALCMYMMVEVMVLLTPFPTFAFTYNVPKAHNMFVLMLDP
jgi:hypothetical protein